MFDFAPENWTLLMVVLESPMETKRTPLSLLLLGARRPVPMKREEEDWSAACCFDVSILEILSLSHCLRGGVLLPSAGCHMAHTCDCR